MAPVHQTEVILLGAIQRVIRTRHPGLAVTHAAMGSPRRAEGEAFIAGIFRRRYAAELHAFAPNLVLLEAGERICAAAGWRCAGAAPLFLETYLDRPVEAAIGHVAGHPVPRERIVEVGNLASDQPGGSIDVILAMARHLDGLGYEWVVFTATRELIGIFRRLGLPPLALASADPDRLGAGADDWGSYYASEPVVVAGRIRLALERAQRCG
ncbi:MAG: thermostable hemolysin [Gammaproteobacteria bacterium]